VRRHALSLLIGLGACALLAVHTNEWRADNGLRTRNARRLWEDISIAASSFGRQAAPLGPEPIVIGDGEGFALRRAYQRRLPEAADAAGIRSWEFWRTVRVKPRLARAELVPRISDDAGRAQVLLWGFRLVGGVAPYLGLWIGALMCAPVLLWTAWELGNSGRHLAAGLFLLLLVCSPFVVELLSLPYSAVGFWLIALLALVPFGAYAFLGTSRSRVGFGLRMLATGLLLAVCILCRSGTVLLVPGYLAAAAVAAFRLFPTAEPLDLRRPRQALAQAWPALAAWTLAAAALLGPYAALRTEHHHYAWPGLWEGLGDFDRTKGHTWSDGEARRALKQAGVVVPRGMGVEFESPENAAVFRRLVLGHIREDPAWYLTILGKRVVATLTQWRLHPRAATHGATLAWSTTPNEGAMDIYYRLATTADILGFDGRRVELPIALLPLPSLALLGLWLAARRSSALASSREPLTRAVCLWGCIAAIAFVHPVLITTASALETEAFVVVYMLGAALLVDPGLLGRYRARFPGAREAAALQ
jgi:hypothetical protein